MPPELDVAAILGALRRHDVKFVLIGGMAGLIHGSPFPTEDIDITPERSRDNLARLSDALRELNAKVRAPGSDEGLPFAHDADSLAGVSIWNLTTAHGDLDISFVPNGTDGYDDLARDASQTNVFGLTVAVSSLADIIRSKQAANRPKDQRVLPTLREILASRYQKDDSDQTLGSNLTSVASSRTGDATVLPVARMYPRRSAQAPNCPHCADGAGGDRHRGRRTVLRAPRVRG